MMPCPSCKVLSKPGSSAKAIGLKRDCSTRPLPGEQLGRPRIPREARERLAQCSARRLAYGRASCFGGGADALMFERERLLPPAEPLPLATRLRRAIDNSVAPEPTVGQVRLYDELRRKHGLRDERRRPYGSCNCAGLVWAARRTAIYETTDWNAILADDSYRRVTTPMVGDLAIYFGTDHRVGFVHVGMVVRLEAVLSGSEGEIAVVLSKLDDTSGELIHRAPDLLPLFKALEPIEIQFWTDRP
jgi:hypothetical protein